MTNSRALSADISKAFRVGISTFCYFDGASVDSVDNMIVNAIKKYCPYVSVIDLPAWKVMQSQSQYEPIKNKVQERARLAVCDCLNLTFSQSYEQPILIRQPNNTQQWPDILIVYKRRGLGIEVKSSKHDQIVWNSGLPRKNSIYIYNGEVTAHNNVPNTTYFLGQHIITLKELELLHKAGEANHKVSKIYNDMLSTSKWSLYARPMFSYSGRFLVTDDRKRREADVIAFLKEFLWE